MSKLKHDAARLIVQCVDVRGSAEQRAVQMAAHRVDQFVGYAEEICRQLGGKPAQARKAAVDILRRKAFRRKRANAAAVGLYRIADGKAERVAWFDTLKINAGDVVYIRGRRMVCPKADGSAAILRTRAAMDLMPDEFKRSDAPLLKAPPAEFEAVSRRLKMMSAFLSIFAADVDNFIRTNKRGRR